jgi:hypothetical protein
MLFFTNITLNYRDYVNYEDFVNALESHADKQTSMTSTLYGRNPAADITPRDNLRDNARDSLRDRDKERWFSGSNTGGGAGRNYYNQSSLQSSVESTPRNQNNMYDSLNKFRSTLQGFQDEGPAANAQTETDEYGDDYQSFRGNAGSNQSRYNYSDNNLRGSLSPPKVADSTSFGRSRGGSQYGAGGSSTAGHLSPVRRSGGQSSSFVAPKTSPSRVGALLWGSHTPLSSKGNVPFIDENTWCCAVCLYAENPSSSSQCTICDSVNHNMRPVRTVIVCIRSSQLLNRLLFRRTTN